MEIIKSHSVLKRDSRVKDVLSVIIFIGGFLIIWQLFFSLELWPRVSLPSPLMVAESLIDLISDNTLLIRCWRDIVEVINRPGNIDTHRRRDWAHHGQI